MALPGSFVVSQTQGGLSIGQAHGDQSVRHPGAFGFAFHVGGHQGAGADTLRQEDHLAFLHASFSKHVFHFGHAVDRETQRQFGRWWWRRVVEMGGGNRTQR